jgi:hypothetical protein
LFIVTVALAAIVNGPKVVFVEPPIILPAPEMVTGVVPALNVPPLFVQFPARLTAVAVPTLNVPAVSVIEVFIASVVVLPPTLRV